jgi:hypothetical protein
MGLLHGWCLGTLPFVVFDHLLTWPIGRNKSNRTKVSTCLFNGELLAQLRCDDIAQGALDIFNEEGLSVRRSVEAGNVVEGLGGSMVGWKENTLGSS